MMIVAVSGFVMFLGFLLAGGLALVVTAALDRSIGKEKALLLFAGVLFLFTMWQCRPTKITAKARAGDERKVPAERLDVAGTPYRRPELDRPADFRNPFQKHSDTRPLEPIEIEPPPWLPLLFALPPTVPGPAPGARWVLRGEQPKLEPGDGSTIPPMPAAEFEDHKPVADDVYDWVMEHGHKLFIYVRALRAGGPWVQEGKDGFDRLKWMLTQREPGWEQMEIEWANVGAQEKADKRVAPTDILKAKRENRAETKSNRFDRWFARRSVDNLYREALKRNGLPIWNPEQSIDLGNLQAAAEEMAELGRTGKEGRGGWRKAAALLEMARQQAEGKAPAETRAQILKKLVEAYHSLRDEQAVLRSLAEYARTRPDGADPWLRLGQLHLESLGLPLDALGYFDAAVDRGSRATESEAQMGRGDALSALGRHEEALAAYESAGNTSSAKVRVAEAQLRLGRVSDAASTIDSVSMGGGDDTDPRALLAQGGVYYALGDLEQARASFATAALVGTNRGLRYRAQALYDLGLTSLRLGQADAAVAAFEACEKALREGSAPMRFDDETVSPAFGRALVALAAGNEGDMRTALQEAREEAPRVAYHEMLAGMVASREEDDAAAVRAFERAMRLAQTYPELDGWLARTRLRLGQLALEAGTPIEEASQEFEAAVAFASRASDNERARDAKSYRPQVREAWVRIGAVDVPYRRRYKEARDTAAEVLNRVDVEQPEALAIKGYCNYYLARDGFPPGEGAVNDPYDPCLRDLQGVKEKVPADDEGPDKVWRDYADQTLAQIKHWKNLEEKTVTFETGEIPPDWVLEEGGVRGISEDGAIHFRGDARKDGSLDEPNAWLSSKKLFKVGEFEDVRVRLKIPGHDASGATVNTITFGVQVQKAGARRSSRSKFAGIGIFYDRGKMAFRIGGGEDERFEDGLIHRMVPETPWPGDDWVEIRIVRTDTKDGHVEIFLDDDLTDDIEPTKPIKADNLSGFKGSTRANAELWIGGFSTQAQRFRVAVKEIRIIRRKSAR